MFGDHVVEHRSMSPPCQAARELWRVRLGRGGETDVHNPSREAQSCGQTDGIAVLPKDVGDVRCGVSDCAEATGVMQDCCCVGPERVQ